MRIALVLLASCVHARPPLAPAGWTTVARAAEIEVAVERALYERPASPHFFIHVRITNHRATDIGVDLRRYFEVFYPNQWGASQLDHRDVIDEERKVLSTFDDAAETRRSREHGLTAVRRGESVDYYSEFNASNRGEVDLQAASAKFVIVAIDGQLAVADEGHAQRLTPNDAMREVPVPAPVAWKTIPTGAKILTD